MAYHSIVYLFVFLPAVLLLYQLIPQRFRWVVLTLAGYAFFWLISGKLVVYLIGTTAFVYVIGLLLESQKEKPKQVRKWILILGIVAVLSVLIYLKYSHFFADSINYLRGTGTMTDPKQLKKILLPIGISFYSLQAIGYMVDVYWGKIKAQHHPGKIALFLGFFPQIMEGPISLYSQTADVLWEGKPLEVDNLRIGSLRIFWGLFKKMIIADRLFIPVSIIFNHYHKYSGVSIVVGAIAYTVQLYMEFSGAMDIVIGSGKLFGITLPENFRQPFVSKNAAEFWKRWHITLGVWFKTYIFYPVSVSKGVKKWNKFAKKKIGKQGAKIGISAMCLFPVWLCNGLWHGPRWSYVFYGMYYFVILLFGVAVEPIRKQVISLLHADEHAWYWKALQIGKTWIIIFTGELFFRAKTLTAGIEMFRSIFKEFHISQLFDPAFWTFGLDSADYLIIVISCLVVGIVGTIKEQNLLGEEGWNEFRTPLRWTLYYSLIFAVVIFGAYGVGYQKVDLIYAGF